jgi:hypothetical protein
MAAVWELMPDLAQSHYRQAKDSIYRVHKRKKILPQNMDHVLGLDSLVRSVLSHLESLPPGSF